MPRWPGRTLLVTLLAVASATAADSSPVESAIARLGSAEFAEREAAQAELLRRGADQPPRGRWPPPRWRPTTPKSASGRPASSPP